MHDFPVFIFAAAIIAVVAIASTIMSQGRRGLMRDAVRPWEGRVEDGHWFSYPSATLRFGTTQAQVNYTKRGKNRRYTHLTIPFSDPRLRLEIYPQTLLQQLRKLLSMQDIEIGAPAFDDAFIITGNNEPLIREYLDAQTQAAVFHLARLGTYYTPDLHLSISGGTLRITKNSWLSHGDELKRFISLCEQLYDGLLHARHTGIEFLPPVSSSDPARANAGSRLAELDLAAGQCRVCGDSLAQKIVYCASCQTPHHLDCWHYFGSCSVYACGQKRFVSRIS